METIIGTTFVVKSCRRNESVSRRLLLLAALCEKRAPRANCDKSAHGAPAKVPRDRFVQNFVEIATRRCLDALRRTTAELRAIFRRALRDCKYHYLFKFGLSTESTFCFNGMKNFTF